MEKRGGQAKVCRESMRMLSIASAELQSTVQYSRVQCSKPRRETDIDWRKIRGGN